MLFHRCVAKKKCFAPAALYKPFGEQAAGVRSLSQFQALQDGEKELAGLRELGLTDTEIQVWQSRDTPEAMEKVKPAGDSQVSDNRRSRVRFLVLYVWRVCVSSGFLWFPLFCVKPFSHIILLCMCVFS